MIVDILLCTNLTKYCVPCFLRVDLASDEFHSYLEPYLHEKTAHFMHELTSFASSPFDMIAYDQNVTYDWPDRHPEHATQRRKETTPPGKVYIYTVHTVLVIFLEQS